MHNVRSGKSIPQQETNGALSVWVSMAGLTFSEEDGQSYNRDSVSKVRFSSRPSDVFRRPRAHTSGHSLQANAPFTAVHL